MLKAIHASEDVAAAREKALQVIAKLRALRLTTAAELATASFEETLSYYSFPEEHWRRIRTNNPLERVLREIRRRTRVVGAFPGRSIGSQPGRGTLTAYRRDRLVDQEILEHRAAEGPADERGHRGLSQRRASPAQIKVRKNLDTSAPGDGAARKRASRGLGWRSWSPNGLPRRVSFIHGLTGASPSNTRGKSRMLESGLSGSVRVEP
jgi:hypothetical protein